MDLAEKLRISSADQRLGYAANMRFGMANDSVLLIDSVDIRHRHDQSIWYLSNIAQQ